MPYNFVTNSFYAKKLCSRLSQAKCDFRRKKRFCFWAPFGGLIRSNVRWLAHWKARSRLPNSVNWTFFAMCYGWGVTSEYPFKIGDFAPTGPLDPKFLVQGVPTSHQPFFFSQNYRLNDLWYMGIKIWTDLSSVLSQCTRLTHRRTERQNSHRQTESAFHAAQYKFWRVGHPNLNSRVYTKIRAEPRLWNSLPKVRQSRRVQMVAEDIPVLEPQYKILIRRWNSDRTWTFFTTTSYTHIAFDSRSMMTVAITRLWAS